MNFAVVLLRQALGEMCVLISWAHLATDESVPLDFKFESR